MFRINLRRLRIECNFSQKKLAELIGVSPKTISHWENNYSEPDIAQITNLKRIFDTTYEDLLE